MNYAELTDDAGNYVAAYIKEHADDRLLYHDIGHTRDVVTAAIQIANHYQLNETDFFTVVIAAWFHDLGYFAGSAERHEETGASLATGFLEQRQVDKTVIENVRKCILATAMPQRPDSLLEKIVCDADLFHFGSAGFSERSKLLRKELESRTGKHISKSEWRTATIALLQNHQYQTDYCRLLLNDGKKENLDNLLKKEHIPLATQPPLPATMPPTKGNREKLSGQPGRGIETMFRITSSNNQRLSDMADNKAHILITVNSIILSAIISLLLRKLDENSFLTFPTFTLLTVSVITIVVAIIATRPSLPSGIFTENDIDEKKVNLLFFGNFYKMKLEDYEKGMRSVMSDYEFLYGTLIRDVYSQGVVLGRKYKLLRVAYTVFMFGLVISVLGYVSVFLMWK